MIVNADATQIYRDLPILSAGPGSEERAKAEHRLFGVQDGALPCSAADWAEMARREIADIHGRGSLPILVGGTGLYLRTLLNGIAPVPRIDAEVRRQVREAPVEENRARLERLDPDAAARLGPADTARISRALEVILSSGRTLAEWQKEKSGGIAGQIALTPLVLLPSRDWLYARCDERFARMVEQGAVDEVKALLERKLNPSLPVMRAIGVAELSPICAATCLSGTPFPPASKRRGATPSANIPGSRTSRRTIGRAFATFRSEGALALLEPNR